VAVGVVAVAVAVAGWQCGSNEPKMSEIGAVLAEFDMLLCDSGSGGVVVAVGVTGCGSGGGRVAVRFG
jgi:hypothetical protein